MVLDQKNEEAIEMDIIVIIVEIIITVDEIITTVIGLINLFEVIVLRVINLNIWVRDMVVLMVDVKLIYDY